jgi:hypothetical protein
LADHIVVITAGLNVGNDFTDLAGSNAFLTTGSIAKGGQVFDLNDINQCVTLRLLSFD